MPIHVRAQDQFPERGVLILSVMALIAFNLLGCKKKGDDCAKSCQENYEQCQASASSTAELVNCNNEYTNCNAICMSAAYGALLGPEADGLETRPEGRAFSGTSDVSGITVRYRLAMAGAYRLSLWTLDGALIDELTGYATAGEASHTWNASNLASGVYVCRLRSHDIASQATVLLVK